MPEHFHFIHPLWLLALLPLGVLLWAVAHRDHVNNPWRGLVDDRLRPLLLNDRGTHASRAPLWLLSTGWLLAVLALADPTWEQQPEALLQTGTSRVIVLDLSRSMLAADLKPSRLARAGFKVEDILAHDAEGQTGLVVFAGDAFTVSPLTRDADTIRAQLKALHPSIMPTQGSRADLGLLKALELLQQVDAKSGQVILIADGVENGQAVSAAAQLRTSGYEVSVLGVGTPAGAPVPGGRRGTARDTSSQPLLARLDADALAAIAEAGSGRYAGLQGDQGDLDYLLHVKTDGRDAVQASDLQSQKWKGQGPLLVVLILPLAALAFRRGWILGMLLCAGTLVPPQPAMAFSWGELWQRADQRAAQALQDGEYEQAARLAEDPTRRGSARYKQGDYDRALQDFSDAPGADAAYNRGNALARLSKYKAAIAAYDQALGLQPGMEDALINKAAVEKLLKQQQQNQQEQDEEASSKQADDQEQSSQQQQASSDQGDPDQQAPDTQADSDSAGDQEQASQPDDAQAEESQAGDQGETEQQQIDAENQFAKANQQLDKARDDEQSDQAEQALQQEPDDGQEGANEEVADRAPSTDRQEQPHAPEPTAEAEALNDEEQIAAQQWLRRIPDDPGGLLRRKFLYQYRQRARRPDGSNQDW